MKLIYQLLMVAALVLAMVSCAKGDGDAEYGNGIIYFPQTTQSGGLNNQYKVPYGEGSYTYNFKVEDGNILIMMGVSRSGKIARSSFSVDIVEDKAAAAQFIEDSNANEPGRYMPIPDGKYSFPNKVEVSDGEYDASFYITVPASLADDSSLASKVLVLALKLDNPTKYELSSTNTEVIVLLDVDAMKMYL